MPITIKTDEIKVRKENGGYKSINAVSESTTDEQIRAINEAGTSNVTKINTKAAEVTSQLASAGELEDMIADAFDPNTNYSAGDYVIQTDNNDVNKLYKFTADHEAGDWTDADVVETKIGTEVEDLKNAYNYADYNIVRTMTLHDGNITDAGLWTQVSSNYEHVIIPIKPNDLIYLKVGQSGSLSYAIMTEYETPVSGESVPLSAAEGFTVKRSISNATRFAAPSDAAYLWLMVNPNNNYASYPSVLQINDCDYTLSARRFLFEKATKIDDELLYSNTIPLNEKKRYIGFVNSSGEWANFGGNFDYTLIPVKKGDFVKIEAYDNVTCYYAVVTEFPVPVENGAVPLSAKTGWTTRKILTSGVANEIMPDDAKFLLINIMYNNVDHSPKSLIINGIDYIGTVYGNVSENNDSIFEKIESGNSIPIWWESGTFAQIIGEQSTNGGNTKRMRMHEAIKKPYPITVYTDGLFAVFAGIYDDDLKLESKEAYQTTPIYIPKNKYFRLCLQDAEEPNTDISAYTPLQVNEHIKVGSYNLSNLLHPNLKWCAMGDSITQGWVSYWQSGSRENHVSAKEGWVFKTAKKKGWELTNLGIGGTGWLNKAAVSTQYPDPDQTPAWYIAENTDFTQYDIVTLAFGINDWKGNMEIGEMTDNYSETPTTVIGAMRKTIEAILSNNPKVKIFVITPLNCLGYYTGDAKTSVDPTPIYGTYETNWGIGHRFTNSGTLEEFVAAMITVCDYYGIQYIDMTHYSVVNRNNIKEMLIDGVHPSAVCHEQLCHELSAKIMFV